MEKFKISSNWQTSAPLQNSVEFIDDSDFREFDHEDVNAESCVSCSKPENSEESSLKISVTVLDPSKIISKLCLVSQSKRIEINQGDLELCGPYVKTVTGTFLGKLSSQNFQKKCSF